MQLQCWTSGLLYKSFAYFSWDHQSLQILYWLFDPTFLPCCSYTSTTLMLPGRGGAEEWWISCPFLLCSRNQSPCQLTRTTPDSERLLSHFLPIPFHVYFGSSFPFSFFFDILSVFQLSFLKSSTELSYF